MLMLRVSMAPKSRVRLSMEAPLSRLLSLVLLTQSVLIIKVNKDTESHKKISVEPT